jgi:hypothetical protein
MGQLGFPLSDGDMAQQMQTASSSLDSSAQKQLSSYTSQVQSAASKVHAAGGSNMQANETLAEMEQTAQQLTSLASGLSSAANATEQLANAVQEGSSGSSMTELSATFGSVATQADTFNSQMSQAQGALSGQLSKIQASLKTVQAEAASSVASQEPCPFPAIYNAVDQLWLLYMQNASQSDGISSTPPQNLYLLASAVNNIYSSIIASYGTGTPPAAPPSNMPTDIENIYNDITGTSPLMGNQSLQQLCSGGGLPAQDKLLNNLAGVNAVLTGNSSGTSGLWTDMNTFYDDYSAPSVTDNPNINNAINSLFNDMESGNWDNVASDIATLNSNLQNTTPLDGYLTTLQNLLNAPLDTNSPPDTLASLASLANTGNTTALQSLQSLLGSGGALNSYFNENSQSGTTGCMLSLILFWEDGT